MNFLYLLFMKLKLIKTLLIFLIIADLGYSFCQFYHQQFDGDFVPIIAPSKHYETILENPFGKKVLLDKAEYAGTSRFFSHKILQVYGKIAPLWLQKLLSPVDSLYAAGALSKILVQFALIFLLSIYVCRHFKFWHLDFLGIFLLITPFFQTYGYFHNMGIIDASVTYLFFYALPIAGLLLFLLPFYLTHFGDVNKNYFPWWIKIGLIILAISMPLSGPLIAPLGMMICGFVFLAFILKEVPKAKFFERIKTNLLSIKPTFWAYFSLFFLMCVYAWWLSSFNLENGEALPYFEAISSLFSGLWFILTTKLGVPLLIFLMGLNYFLLKKTSYHLPPKLTKHHYLSKSLLVGIWLFLFLYLAILPLGGIREYRPNIIRHDTFIPVTLGLIFTVGLGTKLLSLNLKPKIKRLYFSALILVGLIFTLADSSNFDNNKCERNALEKLAKTQENTYALPANCTFFSWDENESKELLKLNSRLLQHWNITEKEILLFREKDKY